MKNNMSLPEFDLSNSRVIQRLKLGVLDYLRIRFTNSGDDDFKIKPLRLRASAVQTNNSSLQGLSLQSRSQDWITGIFLPKKPVMTVIK